MQIGVLREIKTGETRVSMTPNLCRRCVQLGANVLLEKSAGASAGFTDAEYRGAGASLVGSAARIWKSADLILKVKEPLPSEYDLLRDRQTIFTYLHLAAGPELTKILLAKRILGIAYETVEGSDGQFPLLKPMSQIAGRLSIQIGAYFLQSQHGGSGVLLGGIPGTMPGHVSTPANIDHEVADADLVIGAVLIPAAKAPVVVSRKTVRKMRPGSVIVDIAIDQGGCIETIRPTSHAKPVYQESGVIHYAVPNMPALVGRTSTLALTQATEPYVAMLVQKGIDRALSEHRGLSCGVNTRDGEIVCQAVISSP